MAVEISIVVPVHNAEPYLHRCLRGLLAQDLDPARFEILMVDNNSTDGSAAIIASYPEVRLLREPRQGAYSARNRALRVARGDIIAFTDPDCVPASDWLTTLVRPFADPRVHVVNGRTEPDSRSWLLDLLARYEHERDRYVFASADPMLYFGHTNNLATRRAALEEQGLFVERMRGSDAVFVRQVTERYGCDAVVYEPLARVLHLEIDGLAAYYRKIPIYRRSRAGFRHLAVKRELTVRERLGIVSQAVRRGDLPLLGAVPLLTLLTAGVLFSRGAVLLKPPGSDPEARPLPSPSTR